MRLARPATLSVARAVAYVAVVGPGEGAEQAVLDGAAAVGAVIAVAGGFGTLSEIALALQAGRPVVGLGTWQIRGVRVASDPVAAVELALQGWPEGLPGASAPCLGRIVAGRAFHGTVCDLASSRCPTSTARGSRSSSRSA